MARKGYVVTGHESEKPEEQRKALQQMFRKVFSTPEGKVVLNTILNDLRYFSKAEYESEYILSDYAKTLLHDRLGITDTMAVTDCFISVIKE